MAKGRGNKVLKPTPVKVKYLIQAKTNNINSRITAMMKVRIRTVNRVWVHWMKHKEPWTPKIFVCPRVINDQGTQFVANKTDKNGRYVERYDRKYRCGNLQGHESLVNYNLLLISASCLSLFERKVFNLYFSKNFV